MRQIDAGKLAIELLSITYLGCDGGYYKGRADERDDTLKRIKNAPTIEPKRGEWREAINDERNLWCSECGDRQYGNKAMIRLRNNFCPSCGADMRKEEK